MIKLYIFQLFECRW